VALHRGEIRAGLVMLPKKIAAYAALVLGDRPIQAATVLATVKVRPADVGVCLPHRATASDSAPRIAFISGARRSTASAALHIAAVATRRLIVAPEVGYRQCLPGRLSGRSIGAICNRLKGYDYE
jgi:hypothetical protein